MDDDLRTSPDDRNNLEAIPTSAHDFLRALCAPQLDPLFWRAEFLSPDSAWCGHIPFAHWIVRAARPRLLVELGTHTGVSYLAFCLAVERERVDTQCYAVDTWQGDEHAGFYGAEIFARLSLRNSERFSAFSTLLRCTFDDAEEYFDDNTVDLLHIDGLHTYDAVKDDFETWRPKLSERAVVLFHDINEHSGSFGVWRLWSELRAQFPSFEFLHGHGLGVLVVGECAPSVVADLCKVCDPATLALLRQRFALVGERWEAEQAERWKAGEHEKVRLKIALEQTDRIARTEQTLSETNSALTLARLAEAETRRELDRVTADFAVRDGEHRATALANEIVISETTARLAEARIRINNIESELTFTQSRARDADALRIEADALRIERDELSSRLQVAESARGAEAAARAGEAAARERVEMELLACRAQVQALYRSTSRRITGPLRNVARRLPGGLRRALPRRFKKRRELRRSMAEIVGSGLFDHDWYLRRYPDVAMAKIDPLRHYAATGGAEARDPGPGFDTAYYVGQVPGGLGGMPPLLHWLRHGRANGLVVKSLTSPSSLEVPVGPDQAPGTAHPEMQPSGAETALGRPSSCCGSALERWNRYESFRSRDMADA